jgi:hypothetical protein
MTISSCTPWHSNCTQQTSRYMSIEQSGSTCRSVLRQAHMCALVLSCPSTPHPRPGHTTPPPPPPPTHPRCACRRLSGASGSKQKQQPSLQQQASHPPASSPLQSPPQQKTTMNLSSREALAQHSSSSTRQICQKQQGLDLAQQQLGKMGWMITKGSGSAGSSYREMKHLLRARGSAGGLGFAAGCT